MKPAPYIEGQEMEKSNKFIEIISDYDCDDFKRKVNKTIAWWEDNGAEFIDIRFSTLIEPESSDAGKPTGEFDHWMKAVLIFKKDFNNPNNE